MTKKTDIDDMVKQVEDVVEKDIKEKIEHLTPEMFAPFPATPVNLELSGLISGGFRLGRMAVISGESDTAKSLTALSILGESCLYEHLNDYRFIYDDTESAMSFDIEGYFSKELKDRLEIINSTTVEQFELHLTQALAKDKPFIYILDSNDGLSSDAAVKLAEENLKKRALGKAESASYGAEKAKQMKRVLSQQVKQLDDNGSLLIIITQSIDDINGNPIFKKKVRSGGKALKFFCSLEMWLGNKGKIKDKKTGIITGMTVEAKISKNRTNGMQRPAVYNILSMYGVDNITSCIDFLTTEGYWSKSGDKVDTLGFTSEPSTVKNIIKFVEDNDKEAELDLLCKEAYDIRMERLRPKRKNRYAKK